ncbi:hypothetical protein DERF_002828 [Dermatophagoides farinae]|uniref:Uncharacterized protein n=1 Tax=Dermatophagoides farinae TaxID=6954 RepID=A0A922IEF5_DERFA|nr:hypothetical protein DERF_002828 [Dermatophagoides farinae]
MNKCFYMISRHCYSYVSSSSSFFWGCEEKNKIQQFQSLKSSYRKRNSTFILGIRYFSTCLFISTMYECAEYDVVILYTFEVHITSSSSLKICQPHYYTQITLVK